jgi:hypothetical protein
MQINDPFMSLEYMVYLMKYDTVHGRYDGTVETKDGKLIIDGQVIDVYTAKNPEDIAWGKSGVDVVCESTGVFAKGPEAARHIKGGCKKVIISAPAVRFVFIYFPYLLDQVNCMVCFTLNIDIPVENYNLATYVCVYDFKKESFFPVQKLASRSVQKGHHLRPAIRFSFF